MTDLAQLARDTLAASERANAEAPDDARYKLELGVLARTALPVLAQHVLDLREALAFYAESENWLRSDAPTSLYSDATGDSGKIARTALAEKEPRIQRAGEKHEDRGVPRYDHP